MGDFSRWDSSEYLASQEAIEGYVEGITEIDNDIVTAYAALEIAKAKKESPKDYLRIIAAAAL
jgi:hypothetical protein